MRVDGRVRRRRPRLRCRAGAPVGPSRGSTLLRGAAQGGRPTRRHRLLLPEVLSRPIRRGDETELAALGALLGRLELRPLDAATAEPVDRARRGLRAAGR
ncbi:MAG: hypothetical protein LC700_02865, partial [Actinobacteria bacterium]|nr:hypothetical protein [Actinomycetota bacterium]